MSELQAVVLLVTGVLLAYWLGLYIGRARHFEMEAMRSPLRNSWGVDYRKSFNL